MDDDCHKATNHKIDQKKHWLVDTQTSVRVHGEFGVKEDA